jgi:hypothetical protein
MLLALSNKNVRQQMKEGAANGYMLNYLFVIIIYCQIGAKTTFLGLKLCACIVHLL